VKGTRRCRRRGGWNRHLRRSRGGARRHEL